MAKQWNYNIIWENNYITNISYAGAFYLAGALFCLTIGTNPIQLALPRVLLSLGLLFGDQGSLRPQEPLLCSFFFEFLSIVLGGVSFVLFILYRRILFVYRLTYCFIVLLVVALLFSRLFICCSDRIVYFRLSFISFV